MSIKFTPNIEMDDSTILKAFDETDCSFDTFKHTRYLTFYH